MSTTIPESLSTRDVHQWLNSGWVIVTDPVSGDTYPARYEIALDDGLIQVVDSSGRTRNFSRSAVAAHWPRCGALNMGGYAVVLQRRAMQQYRRTYNSRVLSLSVPHKWAIMKREGTEVPSSPDDPALVEAAFNPRYFSYAEAIGKLDQGWVSVALNPHIIVAGSPSEQLVFYRGELAAKITGGEIAPVGSDRRLIGRLLKFFDERVSLCMSASSA